MTPSGHRLSPDDLPADPQVYAPGSLNEVPSGYVTTSMNATQIDFDGTRWAPRSLAPRLGERTAEIVEGLCRTEDAESLAAHVVGRIAQ